MLALFRDYVEGSLRMAAVAVSLRRIIVEQPKLRKALIASGVVSSALYLTIDIVGSLRYPRYSYTDQVFSELTAQGSPVRTLMLAANVGPYTALVTAFGVGVWATAGDTRAGRVTGTMLIGYALIGMTGGAFFPMAPRGDDGTLRNVMHIPATAVMSILILLAVGVGSRLSGPRFRCYSYATLATLLAFGALTSLQGGRIAAGDPSPWAGLEERVNIYATMLWIAVLAVELWQGSGGAEAEQPATLGAISQAVAH